MPRLVSWQLHNYSGRYRDIKICRSKGHVESTQTSIKRAGYPPKVVSAKIKCMNCDLWREMTAGELEEAQERVSRNEAEGRQPWENG